MDKLMDTCEKYDALMDFDMMMQYPIMKYTNFGNWIFDWGHYMVNYSLPQGHQVVYDSTDTWGVYCYNDNPGIKEPYEMFMNAQDIAYHKQRVRYLLARWGYSTQIYEWELLSEPFHLNEIGSSNEPEPYISESAPFHQETRQAVYNYEQKISGYIKDSLTCIKQLVGIDMGYGDGSFDAATVGLPTIDIVGFNPYYKEPDGAYGFNAYVKKIWINSYHKKIPVLIPEGGTVNYYEKCANYSMHPVDLMSVPFTGVAGFNPWEGYKPISSYDPITEKLTMPTYIQKMWLQVVHTKDHLNGDDVIYTLSQGGGAWEHWKKINY